MKHPLAGLALGFMLQPLMALASSQPSTQHFTLDNGLKVIVHEDHRATVVHSQLWYRVGSSYEPPGQSGLSHALEHMIFKGSSKLCPAESDHIFQSLGATDNAATQNDATIFFQTLPPHALAVALEVMADQMSTAHLSAAHWAGEREVIKSERSESVDNDPHQRALELPRRLAFLTSASGSPVIGWMHDLERMHIDELKHWYRSWYAPNNATLIIVGDIDTEQVKALATRYFGPIASRKLPVIKAPLELAAPGERTMTQYIDHQIPNLSMTFNVPSLHTQTDPRSAPALELLSELLGGGDSSELKSRLWRGEELLISVGSHYSSISRGDELFSIDATLNLKKMKPLSEVQERIWAVIDSVKKTPPSGSDLERARTRIIARHVFSRDDLQSLALYLGELDIAGLSPEDDEKRMQILAKITPEDIQLAAQTFLTHDRLTLSYVLPKEARHE
ncbi:pitrilysin family protein [Pseudomonas fragi]|uniref:M16 family metallopeptidase n=1 Tax=Pseudomonas fragi TaxID=296 RepID=UPI002954F1C1|nr:pitrilysin family protein [Pseudomonas fragi]WOL28322.1 pitrilysin family protein [Pseudomonas fragi]